MAKLSEEILKIRLNADFRERLITAILKDAFKKRSDQIRRDIRKIEPMLVELSWGPTPQKRAANRRKADELVKLIKDVRSRGVTVDNNHHVEVGHPDRSSIKLNLGGQSMTHWFKNENAKRGVIHFDTEFNQIGVGEAGYDRQSLGKDTVALETDHPIAVGYRRIRDEAEEIRQAALEFRLMLESALKPATLGKAIERFPDLVKYHKVIMSTSREIMVRPEDLTAKFRALVDGKTTVKEAMKVESKPKK